MAQETLAGTHCGNYGLWQTLPVHNMWALTRHLCTATRISPMHLLRPTLLHLGNTGRFAQLCPRLLEIMNQTLPPDDSRVIVIPQCTHGLREDVKLHLRSSFKTHFSGWDTLLQLQMRLSLADSCWVGSCTRDSINKAPPYSHHSETV